MFSFQLMLKQNWTSVVVWRVGSMGPPTRDIIRSPKCKLEGDGGMGGGGRKKGQSTSLSASDTLTELSTIFSDLVFHVFFSFY